MVKGVLYIIGASLLFGLVPTGNKYVMLSGVPAECLTFYTMSAISLMSFAVLYVTHTRVRVNAGGLFHLLFLGAAGQGATTFLLSLACMRIPAGLATVFHFLYPTVVSVVMVVLFGQKMTRFKAAAIACSIGGMALMSGNSGGEAVRADGILLAAASSLTFAFYTVSNEKGNINDLPLLVKLAFSSMGSALLFAFISAVNGKAALPGTKGAWAVLLFVCGLGSFTAFVCLTAGIRRIGAAAASFINMLEPITSVVASVMVYRDPLPVQTLIGMAFVFGAVLLVAVDGNLPKPAHWRCPGRP